MESIMYNIPNHEILKYEQLQIPFGPVIMQLGEVLISCI